MAFKKSNIRKQAKQLDDKKTKKVRLLASEIIVGIINRTQSGKDVKNNRFKKYNPGYAKVKSKKFGSTTPNLTITGNMLNSITSRDIKNGVRLYFIGSAENTKASNNQKKRKFFGIDAKQQKQIKRKLQRK